MKLNSKKKSLDKQIIVALDFDDYSKAYSLLKKLDSNICRVKIGKELFTAAGPNIVADACNLGFDVFLDLKFFDIPNTVSKAIKAALKMPIWMIDVHAIGGMKMLQESVAAVASRALLIGVTILTSISHEEYQQLKFSLSLDEQVLYLANLCKTIGLNGVVCSAYEAIKIKQYCGDEFITVTPGIRTDLSKSDDQSRVMTPKKAINAGCDYLVIGRDITLSKDPIAKIQEIMMSLG